MMTPCPLLLLEPHDGCDLCGDTGKIDSGSAAPRHLPPTLPAGTWMRGTIGPMTTYAETKLTSYGRYEGGTGSAFLSIHPEAVHWDALASKERRQQIADIAQQAARLGGGHTT